MKSVLTFAYIKIRASLVNFMLFIKSDTQQKNNKSTAVAVLYRDSTKREYIYVNKTQQRICTPY